ncbi:hypothetical protein ACFQVD_26815 [Streptosporangium amethystogenes subsp. fukuiense]|uniref:Uncharacterized protein n=1 Tax=Streptosporangium amethystogenes subsp. fukuiense TaxID=698418 RepID=A0ABW2T662_9ACTN
MSTQPDLLDALQARLGEHAAALAVDVFAAWATGTATEIAAGGCSCPEDHDAHAAHFGHVAMVLRNVYDAKPLTEGDETLIVLPRPAYEPYGLDLEGGAFGDDDTEGWQVVPYSSARRWPCTLNEADSILFRGAPGHISFAEARRFGVALIMVSDLAEARMGGEVVSRPLGSPTLLAGSAYVNTDDGYPRLTCSECGASIYYIRGGDDFADLNAKVAEHTCPPAASLSDTGEADTRG